MDAPQILFLIFMVTSPSECSDDPPCYDFYVESYNLVEGEAFYFVPYVFDFNQPPSDGFTWFKNTSKAENISSDEKDRIHYHGGELFLLNVLTEDSGLYAARHIVQSGKCRNYHLSVKVFKASSRNNRTLMYGQIKNSDMNKMVECPRPVQKTCNVFEGNITWYKNFILLHGEHDKHLRVMNSNEGDEGIYTCICTWTHNDKVYNSSGSRWLRMREKGAHNDVQILSPTNREELADEGFQLKLNCTVFCGTNTGKRCNARWQINGKAVNRMDRFNETTKIVTVNPSKYTYSTAILTTEKVSAEDFQSEFRCKGTGLYTTANFTVSLKRRESIIPPVIGISHVLFFCVFAAVLVRCFIIELTLFFRPYIPVRRRKNDMKLYDAYVVYQTQNLDTVSEDTLLQFVTNILPSVLEEKCGYKLFISGRDDIPGEDHLEQVEKRMQQSRRLIAILTMDSEKIEGFDWQVGLHHALVQTEMKVILIQLGGTGPQSYTHLPPGLQHLIHKSPPIKWPEGSRNATAWNSSFWKEVRYLMPAIPVRRCAKSSVF